MNIKSKDGTIFTLGKNEVLEKDLCPVCGGYLITNYGPGISCTFCIDCDHNEYDYN